MPNSGINFSFHFICDKCFYNGIVGVYQSGDSDEFLYVCPHCRKLHKYNSEYKGPYTDNICIGPSAFKHLPLKQQKQKLPSFDECINKVYPEGVITGVCSDQMLKEHHFGYWYAKGIYDYVCRVVEDKNEHSVD